MYTNVLGAKNQKISNFNHEMCNFLNFKYKVDRNLMILEASSSQ